MRKAAENSQVKSNSCGKEGIMKYLNFILTLLVVCLIAISCIIYFKPLPNRYHFVTKPEKDFGKFSGYIVQDTATGKIYEWTTIIITVGEGEKGRSLRAESIDIKDPVNNKAISKWPKGQKEYNDFYAGKMSDKQRSAYIKQMHR